MQSIKIVDECSAQLDAAREALGVVNNESFEQWLAEEKNYLQSLKGLIPQDVLEIEYINLLKKLEQERYEILISRV